VGKEPERLRDKGEGRMGGEVRSGKNAIIKAGRREGRRRVRAPKREKGRRMSKTRGNRSVQDVIALTAGDSVF